MTAIKFFLVLALCFVSVWGQQLGPLQKFVQAPDSVFSWSLHNVIKGPDFTTYVLNLTSTTWLTPEDSNAYVWRHWLNVAVPANLSANMDFAGIYVDGGDTNGSPAHDADLIAGVLATRTGIIAAHLFAIPNEPVYFTAEKPTHRRTEDAVIAYTWSHFLNNTQEPNWLLRLPMVKSVVKAMDAIQEFTAANNIPVPKRFAIAGASKRGWTTWLTPAVDDRVVVIIPIVMPILNMVKVINAMWRSLGEWSFALQDYLDMNLMQRLNTPEFQLMADIIDPIIYSDALAKIPKYLVCSTGDEFFLPDSPKEFWKDVPGLKQIRLVPDAEHSLAGQTIQIIEQISDFMWMFINDDLPPTLDYTMVYSNTTASITVRPQRTPMSVTLFQASTWSTTRRDFRLVICGQLNNPACFQPVFWLPTTLSANPDGSYSASINAPVEGWIGFMIEVQYPSTKDTTRFFEVTSEVNVVPDSYPFAPCPCNG